LLRLEQRMDEVACTRPRSNMHAAASAEAVMFGKPGASADAAQGNTYWTHAQAASALLQHCTMSAPPGKSCTVAVPSLTLTPLPHLRSCCYSCKRSCLHSCSYSCSYSLSLCALPDDVGSSVSCSTAGQLTCRR
jgi:hypothetical protein